MLTTAIATLALAQDTAPKSFDDVVKSMAAEARKLSSYRDAWILTTNAGGETVKMRVIRAIDGNKGTMFAMIGNDPILHLGSDGKSSFFVLFTQGVYATTTGNPWVQRSPIIDPAKLEDGDFNFNADGCYDFLISTKPALKISSVSPSLFEGKQARMVLATVKRPETNTGVDLKLTFPTGSYELLRAEATVTLKDKRKVSFTALRERVERGAKIAPEEFTFPPIDKSVLKQVAWADLVPGFGR